MRTRTSFTAILVGCLGASWRPTALRGRAVHTIALDVQPFARCTAGDADADGTIAVNDIVVAVNHALGGCQ
jgi:hypothetical protein